MNSEEKLYKILDKLNIKYKLTEHEAFYTVEEADNKGLNLPGINVKNLLIKDKKKNMFYLVILEDHRSLDIKYFKELTKWTKTRFANSEELYEKLNLTPGSVSPFGIINDKKHEVVIVLDKIIVDAKDNDIINFHPNVNTKTLSIRKEDFYKFLNYQKNEIIEEK